jgi:hypothetical protein
MEAHKTPESWAKDGAALARKFVYLDGELLKPREGSTDDVIQAPAEYAPACGRVARVQVGRRGRGSRATCRGNSFRQIALNPVQ